ncbi:MAG: phosphatase PAP2 family protein [Sinobacteraceae bacterium]|nr:phosphatase PAP2 family protein [Nevskiaceae bacterium]
MPATKAIGVACICAAGWVSVPAAASEEDFGPADVLTDTRLYFTAPLRWDLQDWFRVGEVAAVVALSHALDKPTRNHFAGKNPALSGKDTHSTRDAIPAAAVTAGTWLFAEFEGERAGRIEAYTMLEAAALSSITAEGFKFAAGRQRPNETLDSNAWRKGGNSFPSLHATAAFAIGTVLAESGGDDYRWLRRFLGYGMASATVYLRLKDNQHWLSDTVAGGALGIATAGFTLNRRQSRQQPWNLSVSPAPGGGVLLGLNVTLP